MHEGSGSSVERPRVLRLGIARPRAATKRSPRIRWEYAVAGVALASGVVALWITLKAGFLAYPGWLAVQKADLIVGPIGVGLYWRHRRPNNRLGLLLIVLGLVGVPYILESSAAPTLFGVGAMWESAIYVMTLAVILAFPTGRLDGFAERLILAIVLVGVVVPRLVLQLTDPHFAPAFSISGCHGVCPANGLAIWSPPSWSQRVADYGAYVLIAVPLAIAGMLVWRFVTGTPPRRRALAIGAPIAVLFLLMQAVYQTMFLLGPQGVSPSEQPVQSAVQWTFAASRALIWYGFLLALVAAELVAGRTLRRLLQESLDHPSFAQRERMLREALGDPRLRLGLWRDFSCEWVGPDGAALKPPAPGQTMTRVDRGDQPATAIVHDAHLTEDPELLNAAVAVALLTSENAALEAAWKRSLGALADSNARLVKASDAERRKLERDLHDGAQQRLLGALLRLSTASELVGEHPELHSKLGQVARELEQAIHELREIAHGIYPTVLSSTGLAGALHDLALRSAGHVTVAEAGGRRFAPEIEAAVYYCALEAIQNASKHAGPDAHVSIRLTMSAHELRLAVRDDGPGFDTTRPHDGIGLQNMHDRLSAVDGRTEIISAPGQGVLVAAAVPLAHEEHIRTAAGQELAAGQPTEAAKPAIRFADGDGLAHQSPLLKPAIPPNLGDPSASQVTHLG